MNTPCLIPCTFVQQLPNPSNRLVIEIVDPSIKSHKQLPRTFAMCDERYFAAVFDREQSQQLLLSVSAPKERCEILNGLTRKRLSIAELDITHIWNRNLQKVRHILKSLFRLNSTPSQFSAKRTASHEITSPVNL
jgi:hypothetical protein